MKDIFIKNKPFFLQFFFIAFLIAFDQFSKIYVVKFLDNLCGSLNIERDVCPYQIMSFFSFLFVCNSGVSFGMLNSMPHAQIFLSIIGIAIVSFFILSLVREKNVYNKFALMLIIGGAIGNLIDRIYQSCVTDFLFFYYKDFTFPVFNVADCFVSMGAFLWFAKEAKLYYMKKFGKKI